MGRPAVVDTNIGIEHYPALRTKNTQTLVPILQLGNRLRRASSLSRCAIDAEPSRRRDELGSVRIMGIPLSRATARFGRAYNCCLGTFAGYRVTRRKRSCHIQHRLEHRVTSPARQPVVQRRLGWITIRMVLQRTASLIVYYERYEAGMKLRGTAAPNMLAFAAHLRSTLDAEVFSGLETAASTRLLPAAPHDASAFGGWLPGLLRQVRAQPEILRHPEAVRSIETDLIYRLATAVYPHTRGLVRIRQPRRATGLDRTLEYLRTQHPGDVGVMQLSKAAALSQRSLERALQDRFDMKARDFLCLRRHHAVRRALIAARNGAGFLPPVVSDRRLGLLFCTLFRVVGHPRATTGE